MKLACFRAVCTNPAIRCHICATVMAKGHMSLKTAELARSLATLSVNNGPAIKQQACTVLCPSYTIVYYKAANFRNSVLEELIICNSSSECASSVVFRLMWPLCYCYCIYDICSDRDPCNILYEESLLRNHLKTCFELRKLSPLIPWSHS